MINWNLKKVFSPLFEKNEEGAVFKNDVPFAPRKLISDDIVEFDTKSSKIRVFVFAVVLAVSLFIQEGFFNDLRILSVKPEFAIIVVYIFAFLSNFRATMFFGLGAGLYMDIVYGRFFGFYALLLMYAAIFASAISMIPGKNRTNHKGSRGFMYLFAPAYFLLYTISESFFAKMMLMYSSLSNTFYENYREHFLVRILPVSLYDFIIFAVLVWPLVALWKIMSKKNTL
ncbi:MAG: hypothetical protein IJZ90_01370 [Clostridia bacterium]|nr:hypothetical protein [Clostridia bacterium]